MWPQKNVPWKLSTWKLLPSKFENLHQQIQHHGFMNHKIMLAQMIPFPPLTHELQILWWHVIMKNETYNMKNATCDIEKWYL
jgi:hypothetical protein